MNYFSPIVFVQILLHISQVVGVKPKGMGHPVVGGGCGGTVIIASANMGENNCGDI